VRRDLGENKYPYPKSGKGKVDTIMMFLSCQCLCYWFTHARFEAMTFDFHAYSN